MLLAEVAQPAVIQSESGIITPNDRIAQLRKLKRDHKL
jgi:hypothetical protein